MYTKALYEKFSHELFRSGSFDARRSKPGHVYKVKLSPQLALTDYDKKIFTVKVEDGWDLVTCDCGFFDHVGLLRCHSLKVLCHASQSHLYSTIVMIAHLTHKFIFSGLSSEQYWQDSIKECSQTMDFMGKGIKATAPGK